MEIITDIKKLNAAIKGFTKSVANMDSKSHLLAVSSVHHALENNMNWTPITNLVKGMGAYDETTNKFKSRSIRAKDMRNWVTAHLPVRWIYKDGKGRYGTDAKKMALFSQDRCIEGIQTPWYEKIKDEGAPVKFTSRQTTVENMLKKWAKDDKAYLALSAEEQAACEYDTSVSDKAMQALMQYLDMDNLIITEEPANDTIAALEGVVAADQAASA